MISLKTNFMLAAMAGVFALLLCSFASSLQIPEKTFRVVNNGSVSDINAYETAFTKADMESYRYQNKSCTLKFDTGIEIEMYSAQELINQGHNVVLSNYKIADSPNWIQPVFRLNLDGTLTALYSKANLKQNTLNPK